MHELSTTASASAAAISDVASSRRERSLVEELSQCSLAAHSKSLVESSVYRCVAAMPVLADIGDVDEEDCGGGGGCGTDGECMKLEAAR